MNSVKNNYDVPFIIQFKTEILQKLKKKNPNISESKISNLIDEELRDGLFISRNTDVIVHNLNNILKRNIPITDISLCHESIDQNKVNQEYKNMIQTLKDKNPNFEPKDIARYFYEKNSDFINNYEDLSCLEKEIYDTKIKPLIESHLTENVVDWKSFTYDNPKNSLDKKFTKITEAEFELREKQNPLDQLNIQSLNLSGNTNVNYINTHKDSYCYRDKSCWTGEKSNNEQTIEEFTNPKKNKNKEKINLLEKLINYHEELVEHLQNLVQN
jgi:hypothetical protein